MKLRKRTFIAVLITVVTLIASSQLWLIRTPMTAEMDILGKGNANVEVLLNKKDNNDFIKIC